MIQVQNLAKYYGGKRALGPVSFEIAYDECVGFLGLNGAGKTTALRIIACDLRPSAGSVQIGPTDAVQSPHEVRRQIGFLPENPPLYDDLTVEEYILYAGKLRGMSRTDVLRRLPVVVEATHLGDVRTDLISTLSHGFRQRVGLAQAIVHKPRLLILDEPTRGLDPVQIVEMRNMIRELKRDHTVLVSSHVLTEISETCDRLLVLGSGEIIGAGTESDLSASVLKTQHTAVEIAGSNAEAVAECIRGIDQVTDLSQIETDEGIIAYDVSAADEIRPLLCKALVDAGHDVLKIDRIERQLETIFLQLVHGGDNARN